MTNSLRDSVVVVTGAGGGLGRAVALEMAAEGAKVVVNDVGAALDGSAVRRRAGSERGLRDRGRRGTAVANTDSVAGWDSARAIVATAVDTYGRIDAVVNNAGIVRDRMFFTMTEQEWRSVIDVHLHGSFFVSRAAAEHFKASGPGPTCT